LARLLGRGCLEDPVEQLVHPVFPRGRRPIEHVAAEVGLADTQCKIKLLVVRCVSFNPGGAVTTSLRAYALLWRGRLPFSICSSSLRFGS
jgi:hypothetical protein